MRRLYSDIIDNVVTLRIAVATGILLVVFLLGSTGYHLIEEMTFFDGFYMTFITITTIGFQEIHQLSNSGRVLTVVLFIIGIGVISYIASQTTQILFESKLFRLRAMQKQLSKLEGHYILCGYGRMGQYIAEILNEAGLPVVVIEWDENKIEELRKHNILYIQDDAKKEEILLEAGIERARGMICALSNDQDNVFTTLMARNLNQDIFIIVRTDENENTKKILHSAANKIISPYSISAERIANVNLRPHVDQFINQITEEDQNYIFDEVRVFENSELDGKTLEESHIRQHYSVAVIAIGSDTDTTMQFNPGAETKLNAGDSLIVMGTSDHIKHLREKGCDDTRNLEERVKQQRLTDLILTNTQNKVSLNH